MANNGNKESSEEEDAVVKAIGGITDQVEAALSAQCAGILYSDDAVETLDSALANYQRESRHVIEEEHKDRIIKSINKARDANQKAVTLLEEALRDFGALLT